MKGIAPRVPSLSPPSFSLCPHMRSSAPSHAQLCSLAAGKCGPPAALTPAAGEGVENPPHRAPSASFLSPFSFHLGFLHHPCLLCSMRTTAAAEHQAVAPLLSPSSAARPPCGERAAVKWFGDGVLCPSRGSSSSEWLDLPMPIWIERKRRGRAATLFAGGPRPSPVGARRPLSKGRHCQTLSKRRLRV